MTEREIQIKIVEWLYSLKSDKFEFFATLNEAAMQSSAGKSKQFRQFTVSLFKKMGLKTGIPDLCFLVMGGKCFFIELKDEKGKLSDNQKFRIPILINLGFSVYVCRSLEEVKLVMEREVIL